jgi:AcrR family transcriptional regulator
MMNQQPEFKSLDKSLRKQRIIDTAISIFHQKGYRAATLDDVAGELGLSKAALYHYVSSKEDLLSQIYIQALESFFANAYRISEMEINPLQKLRHLISHHIQNIIIKNLAMFSVFFSEENQLPKKEFQKIQQEKRKYTQIFEQSIEQGIEQGYFRPMNPRLQANAIIGMCNWVYKWYKPEKAEHTPNALASHFMELLEKGYLSTKNPDSSDQRSEPTIQSRIASDRKRQILDEIREKNEAISSLLAELEHYDSMVD